MTNLDIYTDGSCNQVKKNGGWAYVILENGIIKEKKSGKEIETTNNKCEMLAAINALKRMEDIAILDTFYRNTLYSDSAYLVNAFSKNWIRQWEKNNWLTYDRKPLKNLEYWKELISYQEKYDVNFVQIQRCSNNYSILVDEMAKS